MAHHPCPRVSRVPKSAAPRASTYAGARARFCSGAGCSGISLYATGYLESRRIFRHPLAQAKKQRGMKVSWVDRTKKTGPIRGSWLTRETWGVYYKDHVKNTPPFSRRQIIASKKCSPGWPAIGAGCAGSDYRECVRRIYRVQGPSRSGKHFRRWHEKGHHQFF